MAFVLTTIAQLIYFFLPAGCANMAPVLFQNHLQWLNKPVDGDRVWRGQPIFGAHKTWRGLVVAPLLAEAVFLAQRTLETHYDSAAGWSIILLKTLPWWFGFVLGSGAILGDLIKSFFKRRVRIDPGAGWFPFDQVDFLLGAAFGASFIVDFSALQWVLMITTGIVAHMIANRIGFWLKLKDTPW